MESARFVLGGLTVETGLGLPVDYRRNWCEFGVVGVIDGLDSVLFLELIDSERRTGRKESDALRTRWLGGTHEWRRRGTNKIEPPTVFGISSSFDRIIPTMA